MSKLFSTCFANKLNTIVTIFTIIAGLFGAVTAAYSGINWIDERYAHTEEVADKFNALQQSQLQVQRQQYEDKVFELSLGKRTPAIQALIDRYNERIRAIDAQLATMVKSTGTTASPSR